MTLNLDGVIKTYENFELGPIDLRVGTEVLSVLGPSGCGKTTLLSAIGGFAAPNAGTIFLNGRDLAGRAPEKRGTVLVFQDGALFPHMTARANIAYATMSPERVNELAETLEIEGILDRRADALSGGERKRVALARSLATDPDMLLLDEPLANLDVPIKRRLRDELRPLLSSLSIPVIYVTHDQRKATVVGDRLAVMRDGAIQQLDAPEDVFARPETPFVASFTGSVNLFRARVDDESHLDWHGRRLTVTDHGHEVGETVWFCIRPEYVTAADSSNGGNAFEGAVVRRVFEGDGYLLDVVLDGVYDTLRIELSPPVYDRLGLAEGDRTRVSLDREAIHVIGGD